MTDNKAGPRADFYLDPASLQTKPLATALYCVATPIGNLGDITLRALQTLSGVDLIACEDTRVTGKLLKRFGIETRMVSYHDHNADKQAPYILKMLDEGKCVALVSDAGTPLISDPGFKLIQDVLAAGFDVVPIPGVSSPIAALSVSGLPTDTFLFAGFLPPKKGARKARLLALSDIQATLIFLESPKRLVDSLADCATILGDGRSCVVAREITKLYETFSRGSLGDLSVQFANQETPKGEIVLLVGPAGNKEIDQDTIDAALLALLENHRVKDAAEKLAIETGLARRDLYQRALLLRKTDDTQH